MASVALVVDMSGGGCGLVGVRVGVLVGVVDGSGKLGSQVYFSSKIRLKKKKKKKKKRKR